MIGLLSTAASLCFSFIGLFVMRETFFPKGLSQDNLTYVIILLKTGVIPLMALTYAWIVSRKFAQMEVGPGS